MEITETLEVKNREELRKWFAQNHDKKEIWIVYYKKHSDKSSVTYEEALDEALCFGWIDGTVKTIDEDRYAQRYTPRRKGSPISEMNKERVRRLIKSRKMRKSGLDALTEEEVHDIKNPSPLKIPKDIESELKKDKEVWENFQNFPEYYKKIRIAYIENNRGRIDAWSKKDLFNSSLNNFIKNTKKNKRFGMLT